MAALPHPWDVYAPLQVELHERTQVDSEAWGLEEALNCLVDPAAKKPPNTLKTVRRTRNAASRRERYRAHLRVLRVAYIASPADSDSDAAPEYQALEARETLDSLRRQITPDDWALLREVAEGISYAEMVKARGGTKGSLRVRVSRLRAVLRKAA